MGGGWVGDNSGGKGNEVISIASFCSAGMLSLGLCPVNSKSFFLFLPSSFSPPPSSFSCLCFFLLSFWLGFASFNNASLLFFFVCLFLSFLLIFTSLPFCLFVSPLRSFP